MLICIHKKQEANNASNNNNNWGDGIATSTCPLYLGHGNFADIFLP